MSFCPLPSSLCPKRRKSGFTLIEVLVTMSLLLILLPVAMRGISVAMATASSARHVAEASALGDSLIHELMISTDPTTFGTSGDFGQEWPDYEWSLTSDYNADFYYTTYTITVNWKERGQPRSYVLSTIIRDPP